MDIDYIKLTAIENRLDAATPGPWYREQDSIINVKPRNLFKRLFVPVWGGVVAKCYRTRNSQQDADLIANAPEDIRYLLDLVESLKTELQAQADKIWVLEGNDPGAY